MRRKPVLSHSPLLFPTITAIVVSVLVPAFFAKAQAQTIKESEAIASPLSSENMSISDQVQKTDQAQEDDPFSFDEDTASRQKSKRDKKEDRDKQKQKQRDADKVAPTVVQSEKMYGRPDRDAHFEENVEIVKGSTTLTADKATYLYLEDEVEAEGNVRIRKQGDCFNSDTAQLRLDSGIGNVSRADYHLLESNAQGKAAKIDFLDTERSIVHQGTYSTCNGVDPDWYLRADTLNLDSGLDTGIAGKSVLYFMGTPILATPTLTFPLSGARHSGFLPPTIGASTVGGAEFGLPYYYNIAPNRDLTLYPKIISRRGLQLGADMRYLGDTYLGETSLEGLSADKLTNSSRYALRSSHQQLLMPALNLTWDINIASDDNYSSDFSNSITKTSQRLLPRNINATYSGAYWNLSVLASNYQVLQDLNAPIDRPYDRLPQIQFHAEQHDVMGFDWAFDSSLTRFWHPTFVRGDRLVLNPQVSIPFIQPGYFITPKLQLHVNSYQLARQDPDYPSDFTKVVPTFSVDSGMVFERQSTLFGRDVTQTLEPRLFYVRTPNVNQDAVPLFDSANVDFNFAQIFSENRFSGQDLVGDSNQITAALVSRYIEMDGEERLKLAIGQRFYFNSQKVSADDTIPPSRSDLLLAATGQVTRSLGLDLGLQVSQSSRQSVKSNYGIRWQPEPKKVLNLAYRFQRDELEEVDVSAQWPIGKRWYAVGRSNYSLMDRKVVDGLVGFEYKADCWALRLVIQRFALTSLNNNTGFSIQLELGGLGRLGVGNDPIEALKRNISGYQPITER
ncbi:LPS-assembly protein LptD [Undibacterium jejuense]|uniref:LPS-assembly protein LptD n=1 Tax=Undibacterium jejuense TaxID=1344949 RepID=A0A923HG62_9BURK|nr:LPS-assembly protein LptD [Undibacterium jejuense]MBC3861017.1 LPS-assembly protein LptD [Undibacterium jejuense]